jgi:hypothetical protein
MKVIGHYGTALATRLAHNLWRNFTMKTRLLGLSMFVCMSGAALAQSVTPQVPPPGASGGQRAQSFAEHKARVIARIEARLACVQAAQDFKTLRACNQHH